MADDTEREAGVTTRVRRSDAADRPAILALMRRMRGTDLSDEERARQGFIQGRMDDEMLAGMQRGTGVFVAEVDEELAGFAVTFTPEMAVSGPPQRLIDTLDERPEPSPVRRFLYGPAGVDPRFQGHGILRALLGAIRREFVGAFDQGVLFVGEANEKSLAVHRHYGMSTIGDFTFRDRPYVVMSFDPAAAAELV
ncbi:MAG: GNAT family N-acetyltransferase [Pseudonocardia sp.]|nr:GNAT family N-acetyltransferase [Pseudonocardia sp.]